MSTSLAIQIAAFVFTFAVIATIGFVFWIRGVGERRRTRERLRGLADEHALSEPTGERRRAPQIGAVLRFVGSKVSRKNRNRLGRIQQELQYAGYRDPSALTAYIGARLLSTVFGTACGVAIALLGFVSGQFALPAIVAGFAIGFLLPGVWLRQAIATRQQMLRHALPDAFDMLVLCMEGGASLSSSLLKVCDEMETVHPLLWQELRAVEREVQMGLTPANALKKFAERSGLQEIRELASNLIQSERLGAAMAKAFRMATDAARQERQQRAEEHAQKAAVKILFPTLLFIFPAIFIVLLGPAAKQMSSFFSK
jgi:tight adherence protein C